MKKKNNLGWIYVGLIIFLVIMIFYLIFRPNILASPDEFQAGPLPSYLNMHTAIVASFVLVGSLLLTFILDKIRKKVDDYLIPEEKNMKASSTAKLGNQKPKKSIYKRENYPRAKEKAL